jgi:hypothetical protein
MGRSSVGGKGSGRRSGEPSETTWGEGTKRITTERIVKEKAQHPVVKALDKALADSDDMDVTEFFRMTFQAGADGIWIMRLLPNGEEVKVGTLKKDAPYPEDDVETFLLSQYGGPGSFVLKPAIKTSYGGMFRVSKQKRVRLGVSSDADAGMGSGLNQDADTMITRVLAREDKMHALNKIQEINARAAGPAKGEEMKADEVLTLVNAINASRPQDRTSEILLEMLRAERADRAAQLAASAQKNPLEMLLPVMAPLLGFLDKKLSPSTVSKWIDVIRNPAPVEPAETGLIGTLAGLAKDFMPYIQPLLQNAMQNMVTPPGQPRHLAAVPPAVAAAPSTPQPGGEGDDVATREYDDKDTIEVLDYVITCLDSHKFAEAYAALRTCEDTVDAIAPIMPGAEPMAFYFRLKDLDERLRERKDTLLEFIAYIQTQIEEFIKQQAQQGPPVETPPAPAAPSTPAA